MMTQTQLSPQEFNREQQGVTQVPRGAVTREVRVKPKTMFWFVVATGALAAFFFVALMGSGILLSNRIDL